MEEINSHARQKLMSRWLDGRLMGLIELEICAMQGFIADFMGPRSPTIPRWQRWRDKAADFFLKAAASLLPASHKAPRDLH